ncbi:Gfo/Idh/MocA family oxidoreductase [Campylobacter peloridis]|uniref:Gfo/Idh/MocA family protein n=1 Tax=Campylobacter peloridis TaxID=488546 RepID=UPI001C73D140|nr:Gfo/Idh/MocA family oxidoreductase [Campylobacter peloridis]MBX2077935.1 Gfo/Idh/MocA family oxidoreductase [Campylobacter peloridis]
MIKIGIAGFGKIGRLRAQKILEKDYGKVVAVYDIKKPLNLSNDIKFCHSFEELLSQDIDVIFICTFVDSLAEYTKKALLSGKHVFCEKPPARTSKELQEVIKIEHKTKMILKYGFNHRYHYSIMEAKKIIDSKTMGKLLWMKGTYGKAGSIDYHKNWRNYKNKSGGGILIDQGIHMLDLMRYLSGEEFEKINSFVTNAYWDIEVEDNAFAIMKTYSNTIAMLHSSATHWKHKFLLEMYFEEGYINLDGILSGTRSYAPETLIVGRREFEDITFAMGKPKESVTWFENDDSWEIEIREFFDAIKNKRKIENGTSDDALQTLLLIEKIYNNSGFYNE